MPERETRGRRLLRRLAGVPAAAAPAPGPPRALAATAALARAAALAGAEPAASLAEALGRSLAGARTVVALGSRELGAALPTLREAARLRAPLVVHLTLDAGAEEPLEAAAAAGAVVLMPASLEEAVEHAFAAFRVAEEALVPALVALDPRLGTTIESVRLPSAEAVATWLGAAGDLVAAAGADQELLFGRQRRRVPRWHDPERPVRLGGARPAAAALAGAAAERLFAHAAVAGRLRAALADLAALTGTARGVVDLHRVSGARVVLVATGSDATLAAAVADALRREERLRVGVARLAALAPFPARELVAALAGRPAAVVLERAAGAAAGTPPLLARVRTALDEARENGRRGRNARPEVAALAERDLPALGAAGHAGLTAAAVAALAREAAGVPRPFVWLGLAAGGDDFPKRQARRDRLAAAFPALAETAPLSAAAVVRGAANGTATPATRGSADETGGSGALPASFTGPSSRRSVFARLSSARAGADGSSATDRDDDATAGVADAAGRSAPSAPARSAAAPPLSLLPAGALTVRLDAPDPVVEALCPLLLGLLGGHLRAFPDRRGGWIVVLAAEPLPDPGDDLLPALAVWTGGGTPPADLAERTARQGAMLLAGAPETLPARLLAGIRSRELRLFALPDGPAASPAADRVLGGVLGLLARTGRLDASARRVLAARREALADLGEGEREARLAALTAGQAAVAPLDAARLRPAAAVPPPAPPPWLAAGAAGHPDFADLATFWDQVGLPWRQAGDGVAPDPLLATGAVPASAAALAAPPDRERPLPLLDPALCTGSGACWTACPHGAVTARALAPAALLDSGLRRVADAGGSAEALRMVAGKLAARLADVVAARAGLAAGDEDDAARAAAARRDGPAPPTTTAAGSPGPNAAGRETGPHDHQQEKSANGAAPGAGGPVSDRAATSTAAAGDPSAPAAPSNGRRSDASSSPGGFAGPGLLGPALDDAFAAVRGGVPAARREAVEAAFAAVRDALAGLPVSRTAPFFDDAEAARAGSGALLLLALDPDTCTACGLCVAACEPAAIRFAARPEDPGARQRHRGVAALPAGAAGEEPPARPGLFALAADLLDPVAERLLAGHDGAEPGAGDRLAVRLLLGAAAVRRLRGRRALVAEIGELRGRLAAAIRDGLATALPDRDLDALAAGLESLGGEAPLAELAGRVERAIGSERVDVARMRRLVDAARAVADLEWRLAGGEAGGGRAPLSVVVGPGAGRGWAGAFPWNPFAVPATVAAREPVAVARGLAAAARDAALAEARTLRLARLEVERPSEAPHAGPRLAALGWGELSETERALAPPVVVLLAEGAAAADLGDLLALLAGDLPVRAVLLADADLARPGVDPALAALAVPGLAFAQTALGFADHLAAAAGLLAGDAPALVRVHAPSPGRHGFAPEATLARAREAVATRTFPLVLRPAGGALDLAGNPEPARPWAAGTPAAWAAGEDRFASLLSEPAAGAPEPLPLEGWLDLPPAERAAATPIVSVGGRALSVAPALAAAVLARRESWLALLRLAGPAAAAPAVTPAAGGDADLARRHADALAALEARFAAERAGLREELRRELAGRLRGRLLAAVLAPRDGGRGAAGASAAATGASQGSDPPDAPPGGTP